jgi:hypothetical protein
MVLDCSINKLARNRDVMSFEKIQYSFVCCLGAGVDFMFITLIALPICITSSTFGKRLGQSKDEKLDDIELHCSVDCSRGYCIGK